MYLLLCGRQDKVLGGFPLKFLSAVSAGRVIATHEAPRARKLLLEGLFRLSNETGREEVLGLRKQGTRPISTGQLNASPRLHFQPINLVVYQGSSDLTMGDLFLRQASRLDAFSGYPFRTWLPSAAPGGTTGTLVVRPSRSSRTRDRPSQISYAHSR